MCWNLIKKVTSKHLIDTVHFVDKDELKNFVRSDSLPKGFLEPKKARSSVYSFEKTAKEEVGHLDSACHT